MEAAVNVPDRIRVLIADDHRLFGQALGAILATDDRLEVMTALPSDSPTCRSTTR